MKKTGIKATREEIERLDTLMNIPLVMLHIPNRPDPVKECHRLALEYGLPEIPGYYGIDGDGEFVSDD